MGLLLMWSLRTRSGIVHHGVRHLGLISFYSDGASASVLDLIFGVMSMVWVIL